MSKALIIERFQKYAQGRGFTVAEKLLRQLRKKLEVKAKTRWTKGGRIVARDPAIPFQPPRIVTGKLRNSLKINLVMRRGVKVAQITTNVKYARYLEWSKKWYGWPHQFIRPALKELKLI